MRRPARRETANIPSLPARYQPGTVLITDRGPYNHKGILAEPPLLGREPTVVSASKRKGQVVEEPFREFLGGEAFLGTAYTPASRQEGIAAVRRARRWLGQSYDLFRNNCEHLIERAYNRRPRSKQLIAGVVIGALIALALVIVRS